MGFITAYARSVRTIPLRGQNGIKVVLLIYLAQWRAWDFEGRLQSVCQRIV